MSRWFRFYEGALDDPKVQRLSPEEFRAAFLAAIDGEKNEFSRHLKVCNPRITGAEWTSLRAFVFDRDGFACVYCGASEVELECDHVFPVSRGGGNEPENLATACRDCNRSKGGKTPEEWRQ